MATIAVRAYYVADIGKEELCKAFRSNATAAKWAMKKLKHPNIWRWVRDGSVFGGYLVAAGHLGNGDCIIFR